MPQSQPQKPRKIDVVIPLSKDLQDMGYKELRVMDQNGIVVTEDDIRFLFTYDQKNLAKSMEHIPQSWESLECVLTSKGILHIKDISLPLLLIIVGNPSTWKTVGISMLRRWPNTYYIDDFNPASLETIVTTSN